MSLYVMRHAPTSLNKETAGPEKIRGWGNVGLEAEGRAVAKDAAQPLRGKLSHAVVITSDLPRAQQTADVLGQELGAHVVPAPELRTWNVGDITGQPVSSAKPQLDQLQHQTPTQTAPNGESYADFYGRWSKVVGQLQQIAKTHDVIAVVHGRQVYSLPSILRGDGPRNIPTHGAPNPGDILKVNGTQAEYVHQSGAKPKVTS